MRKFIDIISKKSLKEADDTKIKDKSKFDFLNDLETGSKSVAKSSSKSSSPAKVNMDKKAARSKTRSAAMNANMSHPGAADAMHSMMNHGIEDEISDEQARRNAGYEDDIGEEPIIPNNENLPAIVNKDIALSGGTVNPEWHQVKNLPGYMLNAIRAGGRQVFNQFTNTPIEDIQMICTIPGMNSEHEVKAVMNWVRTNGVPADSAEMTFGGDVKADVRLWNTEQFSFLLVKDFMGYYVYSWVSKYGIHVGQDKKKMLPRD
jgi:hypothetical protein